MTWRGVRYTVWMGGSLFQDPAQCDSIADKESKPRKDIPLIIPCQGYRRSSTNPEFCKPAIDVKWI